MNEELPAPQVPDASVPVTVTDVGNGFTVHQNGFPTPPAPETEPDDAEPEQGSPEA